MKNGKKNKEIQTLYLMKETIEKIKKLVPNSQ